MDSKKSFGYKALYLVLLLNGYFCYEESCDRRPLGTKTAPLPPDNRFQIDVVGTNDMYIPKSNYTVRLYSKDNESAFIAFTISIGEDTKNNEKNPRKPTALDPGVLIPSPNSDTISGPKYCRNSVMQSDITPKTSVEAIWIAPPKENKCVTIYAVVAVKPDVWYSYEGPLSKRLCEDRRKADDMQPMENDNCQACEEARYQLTFEGMWSYNTHPHMFPASKDLARFSDVVGASHSKNFYMYRYNSEASKGIKMLAEQGNTTELELEIQAELGKNVRTILKATGQPKPNMTTSAIFRASRKHHLLSLVSAIIPSPDWFLGVANLELCEVTTGQWAPSIRLNLYPMDAGTDSGLTFESPNEDTMPPQPISTAVITRDISDIGRRRPKEQNKPFARIQLNLIRTYSTPNCVTETPYIREDGNDNGSIEEPSQPTTTTSEEPPTADPGSSPDCPMTAWEELPCEGECIDKVRQGYRTKLRYHLVDGVVVGKYVENGPANDDKEVPQYCLDTYSDSETEECEEACEDVKEIEAESRIWPESTGRFWRRGK